VRRDVTAEPEPEVRSLQRWSMDEGAVAAAPAVTTYTRRQQSRAARWHGGGGGGPAARHKTASESASDHREVSD